MAYGVFDQLVRLVVRSFSYECSFWVRWLIGLQDGELGHDYDSHGRLSVRSSIL